MARPRSIPEEDALERALMLFWKNGFDRTSVADLSEVLGVGPSSIYNAFGSKERLYQRAIDRYMETYGGFTTSLLSAENETDAVSFTRALLRGAVKLYTTKGLPPGCAMFQSGGSGSPDDSNACAFTAGIKQDLQGAVRQRFESHHAKGEELTAAPKILAQFVVATMRGLSQLACDGMSRGDLYQVAEHAAGSCVSRKPRR